MRPHRRWNSALAANLVVALAAAWPATAQAQTQAPQEKSPKDAPPAASSQPKPPASADPTAPARNRMVQRDLVEQGIKDPRVLDAFRTVPRHRFLPPHTHRLAYDDQSIAIGEGQTITAPYHVAFMTEALVPKPTDRVYEVGTGSGYQSAILSRLVKEVYSVEIHAALSKRAHQVHKELGYTNIHTRIGDGYEGWPEAAPFDAIIVTCAPEKVPQPLVDQLKEGGKMVIPLGTRFRQSVYLYEKHHGKLVGREIKQTLFVPMTGRAQREAAAARARAGASSKNEAEGPSTPASDRDRPK